MRQHEKNKNPNNEEELNYNQTETCGTDLKDPDQGEEQGNQGLQETG